MASSSIGGQQGQPNGLRERMGWGGGGQQQNEDASGPSRRMSTFSGGPDETGFTDERADDGFERRQRRPSMISMKEAGFSTFTSGIGQGWAAESSNVKFRQVSGRGGFWRSEAPSETVKCSYVVFRFRPLWVGGGEKPQALGFGANPNHDFFYDGFSPIPTCDKYRDANLPPLPQAVAAEFLGTFVFVFVLIASAVFTFDQRGLSSVVTFTMNQTYTPSNTTLGVPKTGPAWVSEYAANSKRTLYFDAGTGNEALGLLTTTTDGAERLADAGSDSRIVSPSASQSKNAFSLLGPFAAHRRRASLAAAAVAAAAAVDRDTDTDATLAALPHTPRRRRLDVKPTVVSVTFTGLSLERNFFVALSAGFMIGVLVFALGSISGANLNPAVTIGLAVTQKMSSFRASCYVAAQCAGSTVGALFVRSLAPTLFVASGGGMNGFTPSRDIGTWTVVGGEILGTAVLVFVVCAAADVGREKNNKYQGAMTPLMIGFAVITAHIFLIPIDGCSINPARSFGAALASGDFNDQWLFWFGPLLGGAGSALLYVNLFAFVTPPTVLPSARSGGAGGGGGLGGGGAMPGIPEGNSAGNATSPSILSNSNSGPWINTNNALVHNIDGPPMSREERLAMARGTAGTMAVPRTGVAWDAKRQAAHRDAAEAVSNW